MTIAVELTRTVDGPEVIAVLAARGIEAEVRAEGRELIVSADDVAEVGRLLEAWASAQGLPFVPVQVDGSSYALVPPAG